MADDALPVYDSMANVFEPEAVAPGAQFCVRLRAKRNGRATTVVKQLWSASGAAPIVVAPVVEMAEGQRHEHRPCALARAAAASQRAQTIDNVVTQTAGVSQWE